MLQEAPRSLRLKCSSFFLSVYTSEQSEFQAEEKVELAMSFLIMCLWVCQESTLGRNTGVIVWTPDVP